MEEVKEIYEGALIKLHGEIYEIKDIGNSPMFNPNGEVILLTLDHKKRFSDELADLIK